MNTPHTIGPWSFTNEGGSSFYVRDGNRSQLYWLGASTRFEPGENEANARLIAASPKMFDALWSIAKADEISWDTDDTSELVEMIRKKAREVLKEACDKTPW